MRRRNQQGASAVEFALVLPLLVLFLFGTTTFGLAFARQQGMEAAAREGARLASIGREVTDTDVIGAVRAAGAPTIEPEDINVVICLPDPDFDECVPKSVDWCDSTTRFVTVRVWVDPGEYTLPIPLFRDIASNYEATGTFRCEAPHE